MNRFREWLSDNLRYILLVCGLFIALSGMFFGVRALASRFRLDRTDTQIGQDSVVESAPGQVSTAMIVSSEVEHGKLELNAVPEVNRLMTSYYEAVSNRDVNAVEKISDTLPEEIKARIEKSESTFTDIKVYTKNGFSADSYVVYATYMEQKSGSENLIPGVEQVYAEKIDGDMKLVMGAMDVSTSEYIDAISWDSDVVALEKQIEEEAASAAAQSTASDDLEDVTSEEASESTDPKPVKESAAPAVTPAADKEETPSYEEDDASDEENGESSADQNYETSDEEDDHNGVGTPSEDGKEAPDLYEVADHDASDEGETSGEEEEARYEEEEEDEEYEEEPERFEGVIMNAEAVNLRSAAGYDGEETSTLYEGTYVAVDYADGGWYHITTFDGRSGFVGKKYVGKIDEYDGPEYNSDDSDDEDGEEEEEDQTWIGTVQGAPSINLRSGAGFDYEVIGSIESGEEVTVYYEDGGWYCVEYDGIRGFVGHSYVG